MRALILLAVGTIQMALHAFGAFGEPAWVQRLIAVVCVILAITGLALYAGQHFRGAQYDGKPSVNCHRYWCGCPQAMHDHYDGGTWCADCSCRRYLAPSWWRVLRDRITRRRPGQGVETQSLRPVPAARKGAGVRG